MFSENRAFYEGAIEAMLFASGEAQDLPSLARAAGLPEERAMDCLVGLMEKYRSEYSGVEIVEIAGKYQMRTNPRYYEFIKALFRLPEKKALTGVLLETLAIIAYKQPCTKQQIEEIRGFSADHAVNRLIELGFVCETGRLDAPGRPVILGTTDEFLRRFEIADLKDLPELPNRKLTSDSE